MPSNDRNNLLPSAGIGLKLKFSLSKCSHFLLVDYTWKNVIKVVSINRLYLHRSYQSCFGGRFSSEAVAPCHI